MTSDSSTGDASTSDASTLDPSIVERAQSSREQREEWLVGIFVGGQSTRMGRPKGLLPPPDHTAPTLVERTFLQVNLAFGTACCVLVGENPAYGHLPFPLVVDAVPRTGPLGGIVGLLEHAARGGYGAVLVLGCDFPHLSAPLIRRLGTEQEEALCLCPQLDDFYQPLVGRYDVSLLPEFQTALREGRLSMQPLLRAHGVPLPLSEKEEAELVDWDTPEDMTR